MTFELVKLSEPGWEMEFETKAECRDELYHYICGQCRAEEGIKPWSSLSEMLATACGCEFYADVKE
jgi:hypothetical protein